MGCNASKNMNTGSGTVESVPGCTNSTNSDMETHCDSAKDTACACRVGQLCNCPSEKARRVGYEYRYRFSTAEIDEIDPEYKPRTRDDGVRTFLFQYRTNFLIIPNKEEAAPIHINSETFHCPYENGRKVDSKHGAFSRLKDYWMPGIQCFQLEFDALSFARRIADRDTVAVAVDVEVCTVQQEGEPMEACTARAISTEKLAPMYLWPGAGAGCSGALHPELVEFLRGVKRERVESIDEWGWPRSQRGQRFIMGECGVCRRSAGVGDEVTELPECKHVFHSHCVFRWLEKYNMCPTCRFPAYAVDVAATMWL